MSLETTLTDRNRTHGDFHEQAELSGILKELLRTQANWRLLTYSQKEALEMIAVKVSRIMTGNPNHKDSWHDIAGYATLAERGCQDEVTR